MSKEVSIKLYAYKTIEYGEDLESIEELLQESLEEAGFSVQVYDAEVQDN